MGRMNKFTLLRAVIGIFSLKIYPKKEKLLDLEKSLINRFTTSPRRRYLTTTFSERSIILKSFKHKID